MIIHETELPENAAILNISFRSSILIDNLLQEGYSNIIANDLSDESLKHKYGKSDKIKFIVVDLLNLSKLKDLKNIYLWN